MMRDENGTHMLRGSDDGRVQSMKKKTDEGSRKRNQEKTGWPAEEEKVRQATEKGGGYQKTNGSSISKSPMKGPPADITRGGNRKSRAVNGCGPIIT